MDRGPGRGPGQIRRQRLQLLAAHRQGLQRPGRIRIPPRRHGILQPLLTRLRRGESMRRALLLLPMLALGCGGIKNTNPLQSLAGPTDNTRYGFENSVMGWHIPSSPTFEDQATQSTQVSFFGVGSLAVHVTSLDKSAAALVTVEPSAMPDWRGKTV